MNENLTTAIALLVLFASFVALVVYVRRDTFAGAGIRVPDQQPVDDLAQRLTAAELSGR